MFGLFEILYNYYVTFLYSIKCSLYVIFLEFFYVYAIYFFFESG